MKRVNKYFNLNKPNKTAFTLAEVLITLGIIGVVAAISLPTILKNITFRTYAEKQVNTVQKVTQAMELMRAYNHLSIRYESTEAFVDELQNYLKISKRCSYENIAECWSTETVVNAFGTTINVNEKAKTGQNITLKTNTNNVGLVLANGANLILNYNPDAPTFALADSITPKSITLSVGKGTRTYQNYTSSVTESIAFIMDVNGTKGPNSEVLSNGNPQDIRSFNGAAFTPTCTTQGGIITSDNQVCYLGKNYSAVDCSNNGKNLDSYQFCNGAGGISGYTNDYWAGAKYTCDYIGMRLPNSSELESIRTKYKNANTGFPEGTYWQDQAGWSWQATYSKFWGGGGYAPVNKRTVLNVICTF